MENPSKEITVGAITALPFNEQLTQVQDALLTRSNAKKELQEALTKIDEIFRKFKVQAVRYNTTHGFPSESQLRSDASSIVVLNKPKEYDSQVKELAALGYYCRFEGAQAAKILSILDSKFPGFSSFVGDIDEYRISPVSKNEEKTANAQEELDLAITEYATIYRNYEAANNRLDDVNQYISVVEKIANISACAKSNKDTKQ